MHPPLPRSPLALAASGSDSAGSGLEGTVHKVVFHNEDNGYSIFKVMVEGRAEPVTVLGTAPDLHAGETIKAQGSWEHVTDYGKQFKATELVVAPPDSLKGMEKFLGSGMIEGVGPSYARRLIEKFGAEVFDIMDGQSKRLEEVSGIGKKRRLEIKKSWEQHKAVRGIMVFLHQHGIGAARARRIYKIYGDEAVAKLKENPYRLCRDVHGIGFKIADGIAQSMGIEENSRSRIVAGVHFVLDAAGSEGHCALPPSDLVDRSVEILGVQAEEVESVLASEVATMRLIREEIGQGELVFPPALRFAEDAVAARLRRLCSRPAGYPEIDLEKALAWCAKETGVELAESQVRALREAVSHRVIVITGGPGVGKTTILNSVLKILAAKKVKIVLCAPTGRAARRLSESTEREAKTIHRLLEVQPPDGFGRGPDRPLDGDLFVMDETSMADIRLMAAFLNALPTDAHCILVGDVDQLPSVGPGAVLSDIIQSGVVPVVRLTEIFRQAAESRIIVSAHAMNQGEMPELKSANPESGDDFFFFERKDPEAILRTMVSLVHSRLPAKFGFDPVEDIQVLTPMNRNSLGTQNLNAALQDALNPPGEFKFEVDRFGTTFRAGDKVIQTRNNYDKDVFNGDIGHIATIDLDPVLVHVRFDDGRTASYETTELDELQLAYAITIHKSQGSEFPVVVIPVSMQHFIMLQRNLIYTGITRGRNMVILVGEEKAIAMAVGNASSGTRFTGLRERLQADK